VSAAIAEAQPPGHVPPELVWNHGYAAFSHELDDPFVAAGRMHEGPGIIWSPDIGYGHGGWILTRHALISEALLDTRSFSSARTNNAIANLLGVDWKLNPLEFDPPQHSSYRHILNPFFSPRAVKGLEESVREICAELASSFEKDGKCEFIGAFSSRLPAYVFLALMGLPREDFPRFMAWEDGLLRGKDLAERAEAGGAILEYLQDFVARERQDPSTGLLRGILSAQIDGRPLSEGEIMGMIFVLYVGGLDTLNSTISWIFRHLAMDRALQARLRDNPEDIPKAVDEFTRAFAIATAGRTVTHDLEFHGVKMRKGESVLLAMCLANRDPQAYPDPHRIDIDRHRGASLTFATGPHTCLGLHLARREIRIVLEVLLPRLRNLRMPADGEYAFHTGLGIGIDRLPLEWDPA